MITALHVTLTALARIYATATSSLQPNGQGTSFVTMRLRLRNQANTATFAVTNQLIVSNQSNVYDGLPVAHGGVLRTAAPPSYPSDESPAATTFIAPAGTYVVQLPMQTGGVCGTAALVANPTLTALLLGTAP